MSMNQAPELPHQVFVADDHKVNEQNGFRREPARRCFLQLPAGGALMSWIARAGWELSFPEPVFAQSMLSPDAALGELIAGNKRFTSGSLTTPVC